MIAKEWKEKSGLFLFALAGLVLFTLASSGYSKDKETLDILVSTVLLIFLPIFSLLLGASGFSSEFQDGAWAYLFSRPVKKWQVWLAKYFSLLTVLYSVILLFDILIRVHPALKSAHDTYSFALVGALSYGISAYVLPLLLYTTAFSLSILSEKTHVVAFLAAFVWIGLQLTMFRVGVPLLVRRMLPTPFTLISLMSLFLSLSLALASGLTLSRADFSQPKRRARVFTKYGAVFVLASVVIVALFAVGAWQFQRESYFYDLEASDNAFYFATASGSFRFDPAEKRTEKIASYASIWGGTYVGGDKVAFITYGLKGKRREFGELRIMNADGTAEKLLVGTGDEGSPLYGGFIYPVCISPQGDRLAFIAHDVGNKPEGLWVINSDGSGLRGCDLGMPDVGYYITIGFDNTGRSLFLLCTMSIKPGSDEQHVGARLLRVNLESGHVETLAERVRKPYVNSMSRAGITSQAGLIAYIQFEEPSSKEILTVLNPETLEKRQVYPEDSVAGFRWNKAGDKLAFLTGKSILGVYSAVEEKIIRTKELAGYDLRWPSGGLAWTPDERLLLRRMEKWEVSSICLLDANLTEQKAIRLPFSTSYAANIWSVGKTAIVENTERHQLWGVDLATEKWVRIY